MVFDTIFGQFLQEQIGDIVILHNHIKVGKLPLELDLLANIPLSALPKLIIAQLQPFVEVVKTTKNNLLILEYKSPKELLKEEHIVRGLAYKFHYVYAHFKEIRVDDVALVFIISKNVPFLNKYEQREIYPGYYQIKYKCNATGDSIWLNFIIIEKLEIKPENAGLLLFASGQKLIEFLKELLVEPTYQKREDFIKYAIIYNTEELTMAAEAVGIEIDPQMKKNIKIYVEHVGEDKVIEAIGEDKVIEAIGEDKVIETIGKKLSPEKRKILKQLFNDN